MDRAANELARINMLSPDYIPAHLDLGVLMLARGRTEDALARFDKAIEAEPENGRALFYRAVALDQSQRSSEAADVLASLIGAGGEYGTRAENYMKERTHVS
jgi:Flp pilus assembly protein TadD